MTVASQLREFAKRGEPVTLPVSGVTVMFRRVSLANLVAEGIIPATLLAQALAGFPDLEKVGSPDADAEKLAKAVMDARQFEVAILSDGLVSPRIVEGEPNEDADEINFKDLEEEDRSVLMGIAQLPVKRWERFLHEKRERLSSLDDSEGAESASE